MKQKFSLSILLLLLTVTSSWTQTATVPVGDGTISNPYQIATIENLYWISKNTAYWSSYFVQTAHIDASETSTWDSNAGFSPIGNDTTEFTGTYIGKGHVINGLTINRPTSNYIGLFGYSNGANIDSLGIVSCSIFGKNNVGGLVGYSDNSSTISNSYSSGTVSGKDYVGSLVGANEYNSTLSNSYSSAVVSGNDYIGGLVGANEYNSTLSNSYSTGAVSGYNIVGGLVGHDDHSTVSNSYYNSETSGQSDTGKGIPLSTAQMKQSANFSTWDFIDTWEITNGITFPRLKNIADGPIILHTLSKINKINVAYNDTIQVVGMDNQTINLELLQYPEGMTFVNDSIIIWTPSITGNYTVKIAATDANGLLNTYSYTITVISMNGEGTVSNPFEINSLNDLKQLSESSSIWSSCFVQTAHIDASETSTWDSNAGFSPIGNYTTKFTGTYNGKGHVINGLTINRPTSNYIGLFGYTTGATIDSLGMTSCSIFGKNNVGGLVGYNYYSTISKSYSSGNVSGNLYVGGLVGSKFSSTVSNSYSSAVVYGYSAVGGLVGYNASSSNISNSYSTGAVSGNQYVGGLLGSNFSSTVSNSYYNRETSGQRDTGKGIPLSTAQMKQSANFSTWDFTDTWEITNGITFPRLKNIADGPIILHTLSKINKINVAYNDTIQVVGMDNQTINLELLQYPEGMTLVNDSIIIWTPSITGNYTVEIAATDANGLLNTYSYTILVIGYSGAGTANNPYEINSLNDLKQLSESSSIWSSCFVQTAHIDATQTATWNSNKGFSPIGNYTTKFTGTYNGKGHIINGLSINRPTSDHIGLFGYTIGATIDSLGIVSCSISGKNNVGGLVGYNNHSTISKSYSTGEVSGNDYVGGLVGYNASSSNISNCYSTGVVSGSSIVGGLVGYNASSSNISNCYSSASVYGYSVVGGLVGSNEYNSTLINSYCTGAVSGNQYVGGLVGSKYSATVSNSCYNSETSGQSDTGKGAPLNTAQMKQSANFSTWNFTNTWGIIEGNTYPALRAINNNAPFAFADTLNVAGSCSIITNDYDYETGQNSLICKMVGVSTKGSISNGAYSFNVNTSTGTKDTITYCIGELIATGDTLWGNNAVAILTKIDNTAPALTSVSSKVIDEDTPMTLALSDVTASDADNDILSLIIITGNNYSVNGNTITPAADFNGSLSVPVAVNDGDLNSDTLNITITVNPVNDAPVLNAVASNLSINEDLPLSLGLSSVTASDTEGDELNLVICAGNNYTIDGLTITPAADFNGILSVPLAVSDGDLNSDTLNMAITVNPVNDAPILNAVVNNLSIDEDQPLNLSMSYITASDTEGDELSLVASAGYNYTVNGNTITPAANFNGIIAIPVTVNDGELNSNMLYMVIIVNAVNDAPILSAASSKTIDENTPLTLALSDVTAGDADGDALSLVVLTGDNYTVDSLTITPVVDYIGILSVPLAVSDGELNSDTLSMTVTVEQLVSTGETKKETTTIAVYPNPASTNIYIDGGKGIVSIYNLAGRKVLTHDLSQSNSINISQLTKGIYLLSVDGKRIKVVKE
jgi:hypothetical protein